MLLEEDEWKTTNSVAVSDWKQNGKRKILDRDKKFGENRKNPKHYEDNN